MNKKGRAWGGVNLFRTSERFSTAFALATSLPYGTGCEIAFDASGCNGREREREHPKPLSKQASKREREREREEERERERACARCRGEIPCIIALAKEREREGCCCKLSLWSQFRRGVFWGWGFDRLVWGSTSTLSSCVMATFLFVPLIQQF